MVCSEESCGSSGFRSSQQFRSSRGGLQLRSRAGVRTLPPPQFLEVQADPRPIIFFEENLQGRHSLKVSVERFIYKKHKKNGTVEGSASLKVASQSCVSLLPSCVAIAPNPNATTTTNTRTQWEHVPRLPSHQMLCIWCEGFYCKCNQYYDIPSGCHGDEVNEDIRSNITKGICFSKPDGKGHIFQLNQSCDDDATRRRLKLLRLAGIKELDSKGKDRVIKGALAAGEEAARVATAKNANPLTLTPCNIQDAYDRASQNYIEVNDKFLYFTLTEEIPSKISGKPDLKRFARKVPICACHVRFEDVTATNTRAGMTYSLNDDALIYTPKQMYQLYLSKVVPPAELESPRDRGTGMNATAEYFKQALGQALQSEEATMDKMHNLYEEYLKQKEQLEHFESVLILKDLEIKMERSSTVEAKESCARELAALRAELRDGQ